MKNFLKVQQNGTHFFFTSLFEEAAWVTKKEMVAAPLFHYGLIRIAGANAKNFLQGQLSCDLNIISPMQSSLAAYCNVQGRVQSLMTVFMQENNYYLLLPKSILSDTLHELQKYGVFSKVTIEEVSTEFNIIGIYGAHDTIIKLNFNPNKNENQNTNNDNGIISIRIFSSSETDLLYLICPHKRTKDIWENLLTQHVQPVGDQAWQLVLIENNLPSLDEKTMNEFLPHTLNLPELNAVSFKKGCYRGQEIISRMEYKGKIRKHLYRLHFSGKDLPINNAPVTDENNKEVGQIISAAFITENAGKCLAVLADEVVENGEKLHCGESVLRLDR